MDRTGPIIRHHHDTWVNLASNDYLGLSQHPRLKQAAVDAIQEFGLGAAASRLISGTLTLHAQAERRFARFKHAQAALLIPTGYMANLAVLTGLAQRGDLICLDKLCHASLIDAARLSGATVRTFPHGQTRKLTRLLERHADTARPSPRGHAPTRLIVTESVFSMDGDTADLPELCELAQRFDALLIVDEAHATGVLGPTAAGLCELQHVSDKVGVTVSTASKALGAIGGIITASHEVIDTLVNHARPFIYTTAVTPSQTAAIIAALDVVRDEPWRRQRLAALSRQLHEMLIEIHWHHRLPPGRLAGGPIFSLQLGSPHDALALSEHLRAHGLYVPAIRPPTVPPGSSRVRISLRADLDDHHLPQLIEALRTYTHPG